MTRFHPLPRARDFDRKHVDVDAPGPAAFQHEPFGDVLELADVARPVVLRQVRHRLGADLRERPPVRVGERPEKVVEEQRHILAALPEGRHFDVHDVEPVIQVFAEILGGDGVEQAPVRGRDDAHVERRHPRIRAHALNLAGLQEAKQHRLHAQAHFADFVHENRAAVGRFQPAALVAIGAREAAPDVSEQLGLEQGIGHAGAVDADQRRVTPRAALVNDARDDFLADAAFAGDQHLGIAARGAVSLVQNVSRGAARANHYGLSHVSDRTVRSEE